MDSQRFDVTLHMGCRFQRKMSRFVFQKSKHDTSRDCRNVRYYLKHWNHPSDDDGLFSTRFTILLLLADETLQRGEASVALFHVLIFFSLLLLTQIFFTAVSPLNVLKYLI